MRRMTRKERLKDSFYEMKEKAEAGDIEAQYEMGEAYESGNHYVDEDAKLSIYWFQKAAEQGCELSQYQIGSAYSVGWGSVNKEPEKAVYWLSKSASQGSQLAQLKLAVMYAEGEGIERDYDAAMELLINATTGDLSHIFISEVKSELAGIVYRCQDKKHITEAYKKSVARLTELGYDLYLEEDEA